MERRVAPIAIGQAHAEPADLTGPARQHWRAIMLMVLVTTLWSSAGVVTRQLEQAQSFEVTFWRSIFAAMCVALYLLLVRRDFFRSLRALGWPGVFSGLMWSVMFSCFMIALTLTTVANTLIVLSVAPVLTALLARVFLRERAIPARTWVAITLASLGLAWMFGHGFQGGHVVGMLVAFGVPLASASNFIITRKFGQTIDLIPAIFIGGVISALVMLPFAWGELSTGSISSHDLSLLAALGIFQLALPCMLMVRAARHLSAPELALLALLEVLLGPLWAWLGAGEVPAASTLTGGAVVLGALILNEASTMRRSRPA